MENKNKKYIIIGSIVAVIIGILSYIVYQREIYLGKIIKENLKIEFQDLSANIFNKELTLTGVKYISQGKIENDVYTADKLKVNFKNVDLKSKFVDIETIDIKGFQFATAPLENTEIAVAKADVGTSSSTSTMLSETLGKEKSNPVEKTKAPEQEDKNFKVKSKPKEKNIFKSFLEKMESVINKEEDQTKAAVAFIDEELLDTLINEKIGKKIQWELNTNIVPNIGKKFQELNSLPISENDYKVKIEKIIGDTSYRGKVINGEITTVSYPLSKMENNIKVILHDNEGVNRINGEIFVPTPYFSFDVDFQDFDEKLIPDSEKYLQSGKIKFVKKAEYKENILKMVGNLEVNEMKLNVNQIVEEILKSKGISSSDPRAKILKYILERVNKCKIEYTYDSKSGKFIIKTDLQKRMKEILQKDFFIIATEIVK